MGFIDLLTLTCVCASAFAVRIPLCLQRQSSNVGQLGAPSENALNCLCPVGSPTVVDSLNSENSGVERLVIFVYKKLNTGEIITFIPGTESQHQIPDFPEEYGTITTVPVHSSITDIFENSPSKELREVNPISVTEPNEVQPIKTRPVSKQPNQVVILVDVQRPKGLNSVQGQHTKYHPIKNNTPKWLIPVDETNEHQDAQNNSPHQIDIENEENNERHITGNTEHFTYSNNVIPKNPLVINKNPYTYPTYDAYDSPEGSHQEYPTSDENQLNRDVEEDSLESNNNHIQVRPVNPTEDPQVPNDYTDTADREQNKIPTIIPGLHKQKGHRKDHHGNIIGWTSQTHKTYWESGKNTHHLVRPDANQVNPISHNDLVHDVIKPKPYNNLVKHQKIKSNPISNHDLVNPHAINVKPIPNNKFAQYPTKKDTYNIDDKHTYHENVPSFDYWLKHQPNANDIYNIDDKHTYHENVPSFDYWLKHQLNTSTINGNRIPTSTADIKVLHTEIRNVLLQNGLIVTKQGTIVDGHGNESRLDNLKLRPILIGKSISYNNFLKNLGKDAKFKITSDTPFIEGLLLTMITPPKILGIVPLRITSMPQNLHHNNNEIAIQEQLQPAYEGGLLKILPIDHLVSFRKSLPAVARRLTGDRHSLFQNTPIARNSQYNRITPISRNNQYNAITLIPRRSQYNTITPNTRNSQYNIDYRHLQEALASISRRAEKESDVDARNRYLELPTSRTDKGSEEVPDFRIIGGVSATVSGTPLLNRGRSGLQE